MSIFVLFILLLFIYYFFIILLQTQNDGAVAQVCQR